MTTAGRTLKISFNPFDLKEFTLMVVGESGLGKSTLINSLFLTDLYPDRLIPSAGDKIRKTVKLDASTVEIEERGVKLRLTVVDTPGFGDAIDNSDCFHQIIRYIDDQFERYLQDENGLNRKNIIDNRPLDIDVMKQLSDKVSIVPVIAKADCLTKKEISALKQSDEDEDYKAQVQGLRDSIPFAVVGANALVTICDKKVRGRQYPWGVVEVENPEHCDFIKLRSMLITHMQDLQEVTNDVHYESYRSNKLSASKGASPAPSNARGGGGATGGLLDDKDKKLMEKEAELKRMQEMVAAMQMQIKQQSQTSLQNLTDHH
ncbi:Septinlike [Caligus rogercresseyi]|uniref:Septinlike n=1 Tax=Caligus rogercresseyi TaxID=217165 RepID=A0A7T8GPH1_CALRO|nr:Septinlike [Caligus rogercresseyi]